MHSLLFISCQLGRVKPSLYSFRSLSVLRKGGARGKRETAGMVHAPIGPRFRVLPLLR